MTYHLGQIPGVLVPSSVKLPPEGKSGTVSDKTPGTAPDVVQIWAQMKRKLRDKLGVYTLPTGAPVIIDGKAFPRLTFSNAVALMNGWAKFAGALVDPVVRDGRDPTRATEALAMLNRERIDVTEVLLAQTRVTCDSRGCRNDPAGKFLLPTGVKVLFSALDAAVIRMSLGVWSAFNIENSIERMEQALDETPGGFLLKGPIKAGYKVADALHNGLPPFLADLAGMFDTIKMVTIAGVGGYLLYKLWQSRQ